MERLRYTGVQPTTFQHDQVGHVEPGGEFDVPGDRLLAYMRRADIEHAGECPAPPCRCGEEPQPDPAPEIPAGSSGKPRGKRGSGPSMQGRTDPLHSRLTALA